MAAMRHADICREELYITSNGRLSDKIRISFVGYLMMPSMPGVRWSRKDLEGSGGGALEVQPAICQYGLRSFLGWGETRSTW
jgi:hypothetical protein